MKRSGPLWSVPAAAAVLLLVLVPAAASAQAPTAFDHRPFAVPGGAVFTMSNAVSGNVVLAFSIGPGGALVPAGQFPTGGTGTGASLADAGALALTSDHRFLLVVNAGDSTISVFAVNPPGSRGALLTLTDRVGAGGVEPVSLTVHGPLVYALDAGNSTVPGNIAGFLLFGPGLLFPLPGSVQPLSSGAPTAPAQIGFTPWGTALVVTEKNTNVLDTYPVAWGIAQPPIVTPSTGSTPYGFAFGPDNSLVVTDAASGALTSYRISPNGALSVVSGSVPDFQAAPCWVEVVGPYAYTTDAHSSTISTYAVGWGGTLSLVSSVTVSTGAADTDMAVGGPHGEYLFVYDAGAGEIQEFGFAAEGGLTALTSVASLPSTAEGLAAF